MKIILLLSLAVLLSQGYANSLDSCQGRCGHETDLRYTCQCDSCERYGDCCHDYLTICKDFSVGSLSCGGRCGEKYNSQNRCHCNTECGRHNNCCSDFTDLCTSGSLSCKGRCGEKYNSQNRCHCNTQCGRHNNCCSNFKDLCGDGGSGGSGSVISDSEIAALSEVLYALDSNKASMSEVILDRQARVHNSQTSSQKDLSPNKLFQFVDEASLFSKPSYAAFVSLLDNYNRKTGTTENLSPQQLKEQERFLTESISNTELGQELYGFLYTKGVYKSEEEFKYDLKMMWFGQYSRSSGKMDSSGFEHIFAGEIKSGKISGFHNWLQFYLLEKQGLLNYYSHSFDGPWQSYPDVLGMQFKWDGYFKQVGSAIIGCSPEFDLAMYSLCYITRPGKRCKLSVGGKPLIIQTYTWDNSSYGNGKKYIGSAFPATP
ncbi:poly(U)-specific endoribonuclease-like [Clupea harengus]|uniref:Uridylate-specific endoribonuclease n=1 Tax=Clupea harengus TaxID=7950 RepID=A0A6P8FC12_CLUHA|nr:poly(U)-specific endoribonuclease-like [Clupea harengus]